MVWEEPVFSVYISHTVLSNMYVSACGEFPSRVYHSDLIKSVNSTLDTLKATELF